MLVLTRARLIDGTGAPPVENVDIIVDGGRICEVGRGLTIPAGAHIVDLSGKTLIPGLIEAHTHVGGSAGLERPGCVGRFASYDYAEFRESMLRFGVTTVRSAGDFTPDIISVRDAVNEGALIGPRMLVCGKMIQAKGGHPLSTVYFDDPEVAKNACVVVDADTDIENEVKGLVDSGVDWIKAFLSDDNKMRYPSSVPRLSNEQLRRVADAAHKYGLPVMMHVDDIGDMRDAANAGADTIEHIISIATSDHEVTDEVLELLTSRDVWVVPTLVSTKSHDGAAENAPLVWPALLAAAKKLIGAGVKLGVGCDSGIPFVPFGEALHSEMELLVEAGLSPLEAITAATGGNAKMLRRYDSLGSIEPGKVADMVALGSDPLTDIKNTRDIKLVLRDGSIVVDRLLSAV
jgi:enamidase